MDFPCRFFKSMNNYKNCRVRTARFGKLQNTHSVGWHGPQNLIFNRSGMICLLCLLGHLRFYYLFTSTLGGKKIVHNVCSINTISTYK